MEKKMAAINAENIRGIIKQVNELGIQKSDIVSLVQSGSVFILVYYK